MLVLGSWHILLTLDAPGALVACPTEAEQVGGVLLVAQTLVVLWTGTATTRKTIQRCLAVGWRLRL